MSKLLYIYLIIVSLIIIKKLNIVLKIIVQQVIYDTTGISNPPTGGSITVVQDQEYDVGIEILLSDFDADTEYIDISIDGMDYGRCTPHRTGTQGKCFFHDCTEPNEDGASIPKRQLISENGTIYNKTFLRREVV